MDLVFNGNWKFDYLYTPLEYIENTSNAYIDTDIKGNMSYNYHIRYMYTNEKNLSEGIGGRVFGVFGQSDFIGSNISITTVNGPDPENFRFEYLPNHDRYISLSKPVTLFNMRESYNTGNKCFHNNKFYGEFDGYNKSFVFKANIFLFNANPNNNLNYLRYPFLGRIYDYSVRDQHEQLLQHLIPAMRRRDGMVGMYDEVTGQFLISPNGVKFIGGPVVKG